MKNVSIIRDRGQFTIPDSIRKQVAWAKPMSAVSISVGPDEIVLKPYQTHPDWGKIWESIHKARSIKGGPGHGSLSEFIEVDRYSH